MARSSKNSTGGRPNSVPPKPTKKKPEKEATEKALENGKQAKDPKNPDGDMNDPIFLRQKLAELQGQLATITQNTAPIAVSSAARKRKSLTTVSIPAQYDTEVKEIAGDVIWENTKFISDKAELLAVCEKVMGHLKVFVPFLEDADAKAESVQAFCEVYGKMICTTIN